MQGDDNPLISWFCMILTLVLMLLFAIHVMRHL